MNSLKPQSDLNVRKKSVDVKELRSVYDGSVCELILMFIQQREPTVLLNDNKIKKANKKNLPLIATAFCGALTATSFERFVC